jgi:GH15 family glucan-1,4-alpha-glucosidase
MPRNLPLGNGKLLVTFDDLYQIRDFYFPHVGTENHSAGHPFRFGVWADGEFQWCSDQTWQRDLRYVPDTLATHVTLVHPQLQLRLDCHDVVDMIFDLFVRQIEIANLAPRPRDVRLFFHQDFHIYEHPVADTAYYEPARDAVLHYKGQRWFLANTALQKAPGAVPVAGIEQYATGRKAFGAEGTWRDAEDGILGGNPVAQGSVDSCIAIHTPLEAAGRATAYYWLAVGTNFDEVVRLNRTVRERGPAVFLNRTRAYWRFWSERADGHLAELPPEIATLYRRSLLILRTQIDNGGAIIAANDTDIAQFGHDHYSYAWPRDGALVAHALDAAGYQDLTQRFFDFCGRVITKEGYLLHKYNPDGSLASSWHPWIANGRKVLPVQEDETGLVIWALCQHVMRYRDLEWFKPLYREIITRGADWMAGYRHPSGLPAASWDLWEERYGIHAFTTAAVWAGLDAAASLADHFQDDEFAAKWRRAAAEIKTAADRLLWLEGSARFARCLVDAQGGLQADKTVDASLFGLWYFGMYSPDDPRIQATMEAVRERLWVKTAIGGVARYENDYYHQVSRDVSNVPGNPWFICTLWLAQWYIASAKTVEDLGRALDILMWVATHALPSGVLAEQVHPYTGQPMSVSPLTWSHATFVAAVLEYLDRMAALSPDGTVRSEQI